MFLAEFAGATDIPVIPAPPTPVNLYRMESREPSIIFRRGISSPGLMRRDREAVNDLLYHVNHEGQVDPAGNRSNWVSSTRVLDQVHDTLRSRATGLDPIPRYWVYEIQPTPYTYSLRWAFDEYLARQPVTSPTRRSLVLESTEELTDRDEWVSLGGILPVDIYRARRWDLDAANGRYVPSATVILNPTFAQSQYLAPRQSNPMSTYVSLEYLHAHGQVFGVNAGAQASGTMREPRGNLSATCRPTGSGNSQTMRRAAAEIDNDTAPPEDETTCEPEAASETLYQKASVAKPSPFAFRTRSGTQCLTPVTASGYVGAAFVNCKTGGAYPMEYDVFKRIAVNWQNNHWCLTAPQSVVDGTKPVWNYVAFEPCAVNSDYQKWSIKNGKIYSFKSGYALQEYAWYGMLSRAGDGNAISIDKAGFSDGFFDGPSPSRSHQVELAMSWRWKGSDYYSTFQSDSPWATRYWNRSYYDYNRQTISYIDLGSTASNHFDGAYKYCLTSRQFAKRGSSWDHTDWVRCDDSDQVVPMAARWKFKSLPQAAQNPSWVEWQDMADDPLWVWANSGTKGGRYFTSLTSEQDYSSNSTRNFAIRPDAIRFGRHFEPNPDTP